MKFKFFILLIFLSSCTTNLTNVNQKKPYISTGFAYIYNLNDLSKQIIKGKMNNEIMQISHQNLKIGTLIKISNPKNNETVVLKNIKRVKYPDFYKIIITKPVAEKLNLNSDLPIVELTEIKKNKSFIAKKAKIYSEEKKIPSKAPVASVQISNISKDKIKVLKKNQDKIFINIATFYSPDTAKFLKERIIEDIKNLDPRKLKIKKKKQQRNTANSRSIYVC